MISDRFLGQKFAKEVLSKKFNNTKNLFTYVLIADTIGCNLNCWFCYAWKYLDMKDAKKCNPHILSAKNLAEQFNCKIRKTADFAYLKNRVRDKTSYSEQQQKNILKHINLRLPFSRIRISGGEPLFSNGDVFIAQDRDDDLITQTIEYWIDFFEELDTVVGKIKDERLINIATFDSAWQLTEHPVWLTEAQDRIMVRFDTNGIILGKEKYSDQFFSGLFELHRNKKLNNIHIQTDYSFRDCALHTRLSLDTNELLHGKIAHNHLKKDDNESRRSETRHKPKPSIASNCDIHYRFMVGA
ncbi:hypothetical protein ACFLVX_04345 [Chloroflexota bacterium]